MKGNVPKMAIVGECFSLDYPNYRILDYFTKYGQASRKVVGDYNFKYRPNLHEKQTGRRIEKLVELGYLQQVGTRNIRNLKNKVEILYDLTLKGFLASLLFVELSDTMYFKKFLEFIDKVDKHQDTLDIPLVEIKPTSPFVITFVEKQLEYFLTLCSFRGIKLDSINGIPSFLDNFIKNREGLPKSQIRFLEKFDPIVLGAYDQFDLYNDSNSKYHHDAFLWVYYWIHVLSFISEGLSTNKILHKLRKGFPSEFVIRTMNEYEKKLEHDIKELTKIDSESTDIYYRRKSR